MCATTNCFWTGHPADYKDTMIDALPTLKERLVKGDPSVLFSVINDLSKVCRLQLLNSDKILVVIKYSHSVYRFIVQPPFFSPKDYI